MAECKHHDVDQLEEWLAKWQPRLRLSDWDISIRYANMAELKDSLASIEIDDDNMVADILVLPEDQAQLLNTMIEYDEELHVVHELVHLRLTDLDTQESRHEERAVNAIAQALVHTDRMVIEEHEQDAEWIRAAMEKIADLGEGGASSINCQANDQGQIVVTITPIDNIEPVSPPVRLSELVRVENF